MKKILIIPNHPDIQLIHKSMERLSTSHDDTYFYYKDCAFTLHNNQTFDGVLVINHPVKKYTVHTNPYNNVCIMQEPGEKIHHHYMYQNLKQYNKVYSPIVAYNNTEQSHGFLSWFIDGDYTTLSKMDTPIKTQKMSCIASGKAIFDGHKKRLQFVQTLEKEINSIAYFGFGNHLKVPSKNDALFPYQYSIAIENNEQPHYFTEKIMDCFLSYTVPIYFGCTNIAEYFPEQSYIWININEPQIAIANIKKILANDDWQSRLPYLKIARELVLNKYHPLACMYNYMQNANQTATPNNVSFKPYKMSIAKEVQLKLKSILKK